MFQFIDNPRNFLQLTEPNTKKEDVIKKITEEMLSMTSKSPPPSSSTVSQQQQQKENTDIVHCEDLDIDQSEEDPFIPTSVIRDNKDDNTEGQSQTLDLKKMTTTIQTQETLSKEERENLRLVKTEICKRARRELYQGILKYITYANLSDVQFDISVAPDKYELLKQTISQANNTSPTIVVTLTVKYVVTKITVDEKTDFDF